DKHRLHALDRRFVDDGSRPTDRSLSIEFRGVATTIRQNQRFVRLKIEKIEPHTGDISDEQIDRVEHGKDVSLHEHLVLQRLVGNEFVGSFNELKDSRVRLCYNRVFGRFDTGVWLIDQPSIWDLKGGFDDLWPEEVDRSVIVRVILTLPGGRIHDCLHRRGFEFQWSVDIQLWPTYLDQ